MKIKDRAKPKLPPVEPGVYVGICVGIIDLGEQYSELYKNYSNKVKFIWELAGETIEIDGERKPRTLSKDFSMATGKKSKLRAFLQSWNGKTYSDEELGSLELFDQLGKACQLQVVLNETGEYANIDNLMQLPRGTSAPAPVSPLVRFDMDAWDDAVFESLSDWTKEQIMKSTQYKKLHAPTDEIKVDADTGEVAPPANASAVKAAPVSGAGGGRGGVPF